MKNPEETLAFLIGQWVPDDQPVREFRFAPPRRWRFDFAWPTKKVALEVEGLAFHYGGRHQRVDGFCNDAEKYESALSDGWRVYRVPSPWITWKGRNRLPEIRYVLTELLDSKVP